MNQLRDEDVIPSWLTIHAASEETVSQGLRDYMEEIGDHQLAASAEEKDIEINGYQLNHRLNRLHARDRKRP